MILLPAELSLSAGDGSFIILKGLIQDVRNGLEKKELGIVYYSISIAYI